MHHRDINVHTSTQERMVFYIRQHNTVIPEGQETHEVRLLIATTGCLERRSRLQFRKGKLRQCLADPLGRGVELRVWRHQSS